MIRLFWRSYWIVALALAVLFVAGPALEAALFPIRGDQRVAAVARTADRLCWTSVFDKRRLAVSDNVDVWLDGAGDTTYPAVFDARTGLPWRRSGTVPIGHHEVRYCVQLPPYIGPADPIRLRTRIHYRGLFGLWTLLVEPPDIVDPPGATLPPP